MYGQRLKISYEVSTGFGCAAVVEWVDGNNIVFGGTYVKGFLLVKEYFLVGILCSSEWSLLCFILYGGYHSYTVGAWEKLWWLSLYGIDRSWNLVHNFDGMIFL